MPRQLEFASGLAPSLTILIVLRDYAVALAGVAAIVAVVIAVLTALESEARGVSFSPRAREALLPAGRPRSAA